MYLRDLIKFKILIKTNKNEKHNSYVGGCAYDS